jgi:hypothetical protein
MLSRVLITIGENHYYTDISSIVPSNNVNEIVELYNYKYKQPPNHVNIKWSLVAIYPNTYNIVGNTSFIGIALGKKKSKLEDILNNVYNQFNISRNFNYYYDIYSVSEKNFIIVYSTTDDNINNASLFLGYWNHIFNNNFWNLATIYYYQINPIFKIIIPNIEDDKRKLQEKEIQYNNLLNFLQDIFKNNQNIKISLEYQKILKHKLLDNIIVESYNKNQQIPFFESRQN